MLLLGAPGSSACHLVGMMRGGGLGSAFVMRSKSTKPRELGPNRHQERPHGLRQSTHCSRSRLCCPARRWSWSFPLVGHQDMEVDDVSWEAAFWRTGRSFNLRVATGQLGLGPLCEVGPGRSAAARLLR